VKPTTTIAARSLARLINILRETAYPLRDAQWSHDIVNNLPVAATNARGRCSDSGFGDVSNFKRAFRTEFGMSPRAYRAHMR
jgi:hypothetical protein